MISQSLELIDFVFVNTGNLNRLDAIQFRYDHRNIDELITEYVSNRARHQLQYVIPVAFVGELLLYIGEFSEFLFKLQPVDNDGGLARQSPQAALMHLGKSPWRRAFDIQHPQRAGHQFGLMPDADLGVADDNGHSDFGPRIRPERN